MRVQVFSIIASRVGADRPMQPASANSADCQLHNGHVFRVTATRYAKIEIRLVMTSHFILAGLTILVIDLLLGGDNAVVIAMAVRALPDRQRRIGTALGAGLAVVLRIALTFFAAELLQRRYIQLAGGVLVL